MVSAPPPSTPTGEATPEEVEQVVLAAQGGDAGAFEWLFQRYFDVLVRFAETQLWSHHQAEETAAVAFERILTKIDTFDPARGSFAGWAIQITRNVIRDTFRAATRRTETPASHFLGGYDAAEQHDEISLRATTLARREWLAGRLAALPAKQAEAVVMRFYMGLSVAETAQALDVSEGCVRVRTHKGLKKINATLSEEDRANLEMGTPQARTVAPHPRSTVAPQQETRT